MRRPTSGPGPPWALDADAIRAALSSPIGGGASANRIADAHSERDRREVERHGLRGAAVRRPRPAGRPEREPGRDAAPPRPGRGGLPPRGPGGPGRRRHPARTRAGCRPAPGTACRLRWSPLTSKRARQPEGLSTRSAPSPRSTTPATPSTNGILQRLDTDRTIYRPADTPEQYVTGRPALPGAGQPSVPYRLTVAKVVTSCPASRW